MPIEINRADFDAFVQQAIARLPEQFRTALDVVRIEVLDRPSSGQLKSLGLEEDELLLGLYEGIPLIERTSTDSGRMPDVIYLFREDLEDACDDLKQLVDEIRITLFHELGHYFGYDEEELERMGYG
ncbi:MAG TPA: metallopeptidase family protein [Tepidisphaeraceae bacterium]|nr:metallopeptidase family protein [Tepidisphaeraceae bacterium]